MSGQVPSWLRLWSLQSGASLLGWVAPPSAGGVPPAGLDVGRELQLLHSLPPFCSIPELTPLCTSLWTKSFAEAQKPSGAFLQAGGTAAQPGFRFSLNQTKYCHSEREVSPVFHKCSSDLTKQAVTCLESKQTSALCLFIPLSQHL